MSPSLLKALVALVPAGVLFLGSLILFLRKTAVIPFLQLAGATCLLISILTHVCEALHLFPWMDWGMPHSVGHYLDLCCAILGLTLFPLGYLLHTIRDLPI